MNNKYFDLISGKKKGFIPFLMRVFLKILEIPYTIIVKIRSYFYKKGIFAVKKVDVPVISIGNITAGGTGKTPLVSYLVKYFMDQGKKPVVVSRGYGKGKDSSKNDEAMLLDEQIPGLIHIQNPNRYEASVEAIENHSPDVLILDDGYQHLQLHRDLNILLIDAANPFDYGVLPRGTLREPFSAVERADLVVISKAFQISESELKNLREKIESLTNVPVLTSTFKIVRLCSLCGKIYDPDSMAGIKALLVCGIGSPDSFLKLVKNTGIDVVDSLFYPDHHNYSDTDLSYIQDQAQKLNAEFVIMSQKDAVKLRNYKATKRPIFEIQIEVEITSGKDILFDKISSLYK